jgi:predicted aminopeptidase
MSAAPRAVDGAPDEQAPRRRGWRRARRIAGRVLLALLLAVVAFLTLTRTGRYLARAGWEESKILARRRPLTAFIADPATAPAVRAKLALVLDARRFAAESLGLATGESFTTFSRLDRDTLVLVLSGARRDTLARHTWWFPVVGRVPYKGFFDFGEAQAARRRLEEDGLDAELRPASAFSTLGWFNDPLLPTTLRGDSLDLANTVIHELVHNTFYARGGAVFNESFANFVGARGAERFFRARGDTASARRSADDWTYERRRGDFYTRLYRALDSAFAAHPGDSAARVRAGAAVYAAYRARLVQALGPADLPADSVQAWAARVRLNNAIVLARRVYLTDLELFDMVYAREGGDVVRATRRIIALAKDEAKPFDAIRRWLGIPVPVAKRD